MSLSCSALPDPQETEFEVILLQAPEDHPAGWVFFSPLVKMLTAFEVASC